MYGHIQPYVYVFECIYNLQIHIYIIMHLSVGLLVTLAYIYACNIYMGVFRLTFGLGLHHIRLDCIGLGCIMPYCFVFFFNSSWITG